MESQIPSSQLPVVDLDDKIKRVFPLESVLKDPASQAIFAGRNLPSYIKDWLIKCFTRFDEFDAEACAEFMNEKFPPRGPGFRRRLLQSSGPIQIFSRLIINTDLMRGQMNFAIPDLGISSREGVVSMWMEQGKLERLHEGEVWGVMTLLYVRPGDNSAGYVELIDFRPFEPYRVELSYYLEAREQFGIHEWIDLLIRSMEVNPDYRGPDGKLEFTLNKKLTMISRLLVHVEPNLNLIELAPKGTGKSYLFNNLSKYGWTVSGGFVSRAGIFYNLSTRTPGIINNYDFLALDEVETLKFANDQDILGAFKNYLENGRVVVGHYKNVSDCGLMLLGNIALDRKLKPRYEDFFRHLPEFFHSSALVDRIHGFIPGWVLFRFTEDLKLRGYALNTEYFSEVLHLLRVEPSYSQLVKEALDIPRHADTRDTKAVIKLCTGMLKLLYPHACSLEDIPREEFEQLILAPALRARGIIRQQLSVLDPEFSPELPDITISQTYPV